MERWDTRNLPTQVRLFPQVIGLWLCFLLITACTVTPPQRSAITEFGESTASFALLATSELHHMRDSVVKMNMNRLALEGSAGTPGLSDLDEQFDPEAMKARIESAEVLRKYGDMLVALSVGTQEADIQFAADQFLSSVQQLPISSIGMTQNQLGVLGELVKGIGRKIIEVQRHQAISHIVGQSQGVVNNLCDLFEQDFDPSAAKLASQYLNTTERLLPIAKIGFFEGETVAHRHIALEAFQLAMDARERRRLVIQPISVSAAHLKQQHQEIVQVINETGLSIDRLEALRKRAIEYQLTLTALKEYAKQLDLGLARRVGL